MNPTIFEPGQICGGLYSIERLYACSPVGESYLAKDIATGQRVVLTCSRLDHSESARRRRASFLSRASRLKRMKDENATEVLAADVTTDGVYWVAREHVPDAVPLGEIFAPTTSYADLQAMAAGLTAGNHLVYFTLVSAVGAAVAESLDRYSDAGFHHGRLDPSTIAIRATITPVVLEVGYCELFGGDHPGTAARFEPYQAPERIGGKGPNVRSDIYSLGVILTGLVERGLREYKLPPKGIVEGLRSLLEKDPRKRSPSWEAVALLFEAGFEAFEGSLSPEAKARVESPAVAQSLWAIPISGTRPKAPESAAGTDPSPAPVAGHGPDTDRSPVSTAIEHEIEEPTPRVPEVPAPASIEVDVHELAAGAPSSGGDEAPTRRVPVSAPVRAIHPVITSAVAPAMGLRHRREKTSTSRLLSVAAPAVAIFVGLVAVRAVPLLKDRVLDSRSDEESMSRLSASPNEPDRDQDRSGGQLGRRIIARSVRGYHYSGSRNNLDWNAPSIGPSRSLK